MSTRVYLVHVSRPTDRKLCVWREGGQVESLLEEARKKLRDKKLQSIWNCDGEECDPLFLGALAQGTVLTFSTEAAKVDLDGVSNGRRQEAPREGPVSTGWMRPARTIIPEATDPEESDDDDDAVTVASTGHCTSVATTAMTVLPTSHGASRMTERGISMNELQKARKHATQREPTRGGCYKVRHNGVAVVTDKEGKKVISCWKVKKEQEEAPRHQHGDADMCIIRDCSDRQKMGAIVGEGGQVVQGIARHSGARVKVLFETGRVEVRGETVAVDVAVLLLDDIIDGSGLETHKKIFRGCTVVRVPVDSRVDVHAAFGKNESNLRKLKTDTGVIYASYDRADGNVVLLGLKGACKAAERQVKNMGLDREDNARRLEESKLKAKSQGDGPVPRRWSRFDQPGGPSEKNKSKKPPSGGRNAVPQLWCRADTGKQNWKKEIHKEGRISRAAVCGTPKMASKKKIKDGGRASPPASSAATAALYHPSINK